MLARTSRQRVISDDASTGEGDTMMLVEERIHEVLSLCRSGDPGEGLDIYKEPILVVAH
jgi:hypothetical protein